MIFSCHSVPGNVVRPPGTCVCYGVIPKSGQRSNDHALSRGATPRQVRAPTAPARC